MPQTYAKHVHRPVAAVVGYLFVLVAHRRVGAPVVRDRRTRELRDRTLRDESARILALLVISRTYITRLQDRIIKLEMRVRTTGLLTANQQATLFRLTNKQIAALRFASDEELGALVDRAARENLKPDDIKRAVKTWVPDLDRT